MTVINKNKLLLFGTPNAYHLSAAQNLLIHVFIIIEII